jgi:hypothetical protein
MLRVRTPSIYSIPTPSKTAWIKISGIWKQSVVWIKVSGTWKQSTPSIKISGIWK